jgi:hypothetical protein
MSNHQRTLRELRGTYEKLVVNDRAAAVSVAYERGLLPARTHSD